MTPSLFGFRRNMIDGWVKAGHEVFGVGHNDGNPEWLHMAEKDGWQYIPVDVARNGTNPIADLRTILGYSRVIKNVKPDKIFVYNAKALAYGTLFAGKCEIYSLVAGLGSIFRDRPDSVKARFVHFIIHRLYRKCFSKSRKVIFQNPDDRNEFVENRLVDIGKTAIVNGSGVPTETYQQAPLPKGPISFLMIARLLKDKGVVEYLDAARELKSRYGEKTSFHLLGPFDTNPTALKPEFIRPYIEEGSICFHGEQSDVRPFIKSCSVYVLPSYHEGTPRSVLEAMSMARPIITTDAPGCRETVVEGQNGVLVKPADTKSLVDAMDYFINNQNLLPNMALESRRIAVEKYDVNKINKDINDILGV